MKDRIKKLFQEDVADRKKVNFSKDWPEIAKRDKVRAKTLRRILEKIRKENRELDVKTLFYTGIIFHHQGTCRSLMRARFYAKQGVKKCERKNTKICKQIRWLYAGSTDRLLILKDKPQKYGTQYRYKKDSKNFELYKIDPKTTDKEREDLNVPNLNEAKKLAKKVGPF